jgi:hypothetical protein
LFVPDWLPAPLDCVPDELPVPPELPAPDWLPEEPVPLGLVALLPPELPVPPPAALLPLCPPCSVRGCLF